MKNELSPSQKHPQIYIFTTPNYKDKNWESDKKGKGLLKIGYTEQLNVMDRIAQQFPTKTPEITPYELIFKTTAVDESGCWRRLNFDHLCRLNLDQGLLLD